jgi:uncharacterized membrane protein
MDTGSINKIERLAKTSRILGILSVGLIVVAALILVYARFFLDKVDWVSGIGYVILALLLSLGGLIMGISAVITALIALKRNREADDDQTIKKTANLGLVLGLVSAVIILIFFAVVWLMSNAPPPDISTPIPPKTAP